MSEDSGSSPRMRGIQQSLRHRLVHARFIPADAGNTAPGRVLFSKRAVHPRGCGEYCSWYTPCQRCDGSSPRMRGILFCLATGMALFAVHPRGCGEYESPMARQILATGSSPRMRGIQMVIGYCKASGRFIPADAGNTTASLA